MDDDDDETGAARSIEGWVVIVSGVHEEAQEEPCPEPCRHRAEARRKEKGGVAQTEKNNIKETLLKERGRWL